MCDKTELFGVGTVIPASYLTGREGGGDPFQVLRLEIEDVKEYLSPEQKESWKWLQDEYAIIEDDLEEVADLMYEEAVYDLMQPFAEAGTSWGSHDDGCLGFWPDNWDM